MPGLSLVYLRYLKTCSKPKKRRLGLHLKAAGIFSDQQSCFAFTSLVNPADRNTVLNLILPHSKLLGLKTWGSYLKASDVSLDLPIN